MSSPIINGSLCHGGALRKAMRRVSQLYDSILAPTGLKLSQHSILVHIDRGNEPTMSELAHALVLDRSALAHNLKPLERDGYVMLKRDLVDGRSRRALLTDAGRAKLAESKALWQIAQDRFEAAYGADRAAHLRSSLAAIFSDDFTDAFVGNTEAKSGTTAPAQPKRR